MVAVLGAAFEREKAHLTQASSASKFGLDALQGYLQPSRYDRPLVARIKSFLSDLAVPGASRAPARVSKFINRADKAGGDARNVARRGKQQTQTQTRAAGARRAAVSPPPPPSPPPSPPQEGDDSFLDGVHVAEGLSSGGGGASCGSPSLKAMPRPPARAAVRSAEALGAAPSTHEAQDTEAKRIYRRMKRTLESRWFRTTVVVAIFLSAIVTALDGPFIAERFGSGATESNLGALSNLFGVLFFVELVLKLTVLGLRGYCASPLNCFDGATVCVWVVETLAAFAGSQENRFLASLRVFRLLRVFKLATAYSAFRSLISKMGAAIVDVNAMLCTLILVAFLLAILSMQVRSPPELPRSSP